MAADEDTAPVGDLAKVQTAKASAGSSTQAEVDSLRDELRQLRKEFKQLKESTSANDARLKAFSEKIEDIGVQGSGDEYATKSDLQALQDVQDEHLIRSIGSSSSAASYLVNGNQRLVTISGFAALGYSSGYDDLAKTTQSFRLSNIGINIAGSLRTKAGEDGDVTYKIGLIASPTKVVNSAALVTTTTTKSTKVLTAATVTNGKLSTTTGTVTDTTTKNSLSTTSSNASYVNLGDVFVTYAIKTSKLELEPVWTLSVQAGQALTQFGIDPTASEDQVPTVNKAQYVSKLGFGRDIGVTAIGTLFNNNDPAATTTPLIAYWLGVYNGSGPNTTDTNRALDFDGRIVVSPFPLYFSTFRNLKFGASWYEGNVGLDRDVSPTKRRYGGDVSWLRKPFLLNFEYVHSEDGYDGYSTNINDTTVTWPTPATSFKSSDSYVATLFWTPSTLPDFQPWIRFDRFKPTSFDGLTAANTYLGSLQSDIYSIGFNWFIWSVEPVISRSYTTQETNRVLKLQVGYDYIDQNELTKARHQISGVLVYNF